MKKPKEFTYWIPTRYLNADIAGNKPIAVRAWETPIRGLIIQRPILGSRRGEVYLTHKASGAIIAANIKGLKTALAMAKALKSLPISFTRAHPASIHRQLNKLTDRQVRKFTLAVRRYIGVDPDHFRKDNLDLARTFETRLRDWKGSGTNRRRPAARKRGGKAWKARKPRKRL